jgi:hypothetical protein
MNLKEVAGLLGYSTEQTRSLITKGVKLPGSQTPVKLKASKHGAHYDVSDEQFDAFMSRREESEPSRHPPAAVRRKLLVESWHRCGICRAVAPAQFHHMLDFARVKHHDPGNMLHVCGTCHTRCTNGEIDYLSQMEYKARLLTQVGNPDPDDPFATQKRENDKEFITELLSVMPRYTAEFVLDEVWEGRFHIEDSNALNLANDIAQSALFTLHDKELLELTKAFFREWAYVTSTAHYHYHDYRLNGIATLNINVEMGFRDSEDADSYENYQRRVVQAQHSYALLNAYIGDRFPELNLKRLDREAERKWSEVKERADREWKQRAKKMRLEDEKTAKKRRRQ